MAEVNALIGKSYYRTANSRMPRYLEKAVAAEGCNSGYYDWLGQAYVRRAEQSSFVSRASEAAPNDIGGMIDLAGLLSKRRRYPESDQLFELANQQGPNSAKVFFARAAADVKSNRNLAQAQSLLSRYMETAHTPDDAPRPDVCREAAVRETAAPKFFRGVIRPKPENCGPCFTAVHGCGFVAD
jgi:hypothetical protein